MLWSTGSNIHEMKRLSVITNFGCDKSCAYCVWANHPLGKCHDSFNFHTFESELLKRLRFGSVSISGGGEPFYQFYNNIAWWNKIIDICSEHGMKISVHTRVKNENFEWIRDNIHQIVFSIDGYDSETAEYINKLRKYCKVRLVMVVQKNTTIQDIIKIQHEFGGHNITDGGTKITLKKLYGFDDGGNFDKFKSMYPKMFFLDSGDYNDYLMPDNKIYEKFDEQAVHTRYEYVHSIIDGLHTLVSECSKYLKF